VSQPRTLESQILRLSDAIPLFFNRPEYICRISQIPRRVRAQFDKGGETEEIELPWGAPLLINPHETIGRSLWGMGIYDLIVAEGLLRLADPDELALDVGANIGLMTSALAHAVGTTGRVISFEPNPALVPRLEHNVSLWAERLNWRQVTVEATALSDAPGEAVLTIPDDFAKNQGLATLEKGIAGNGVTVPVRPLDEMLPADSFVGVMKLDVEGHEPSVLAGAAGLLSEGRIRDIVFEEHNKYPSVVTRLLESHGYQVFGLVKGMLAPRLTPASKMKTALIAGGTPNYLATTDPARAAQRLAPMGWQALRDQPRRFTSPEVDSAERSKL
jgi:FkbM family methyltransferase